MGIEFDRKTVTVLVGTAIAGIIGYLSGGQETAVAYLAGGFVLLLGTVWLFTWVEDYATGGGP